MKRRLLTAITMAFAGAAALSAQHTFNINASKPGAQIQSTMYGIFFEDINFGADGGLYAEMVENRSFEFPDRLMGWETYGNVSVNDSDPAFGCNPHYVTLAPIGHKEKYTGIGNHGFTNGMGIKKDMKYDFSVFARVKGGGSSSIRVEILDSHNNVRAKENINISGKDWKKYTASLTSNITDAHGFMRVFLTGKESLDLDHVSLFPSDNWHGLRADLVKALEDLNPGIFRFPGGCIVEGTDLESRYQWKNSIGAVENRPLNENRWNYTFPHRMFPNYFQTYGLGFYEFFLLSEKIGASPLPVLSCGLSCQFQNKDDDKNAHVAVDDLQPYIDDALDLIEFANGATTTKWGKIRADMGHPAPFNLKQIGIGNEQWGPLYPERLEKFIKAIRAKYPKMLIVGTSGPSADGDKFDYGWEQMKKLKVDLVDEHYYKPVDFFLNGATRYDKYDRKGPKVFAGEYACHNKKFKDKSPEGMNNFEAALAEAAMMTGFERNADVVWMATYAPLFAHVDAWQWRPDLIWFDNLNSVRSVNYYVQQLYGTYAGTNVLSIQENGKNITGEGGLYATACLDKNKGQYIVKIANTSTQAQKITLNFKGLKGISKASVITLHSDDDMAVNTLQEPNKVVPQTKDIAVSGSTLDTEVGARTFAVYVFKK